MAIDDDVIDYYALKLARKNYQMYQYQYSDVLSKFPRKQTRIRFIANCFFILLHQAQALLDFIVMKDEKSFDIKIDTKLREVLSGVFEDKALLKITHYSVGVFFHWEELTSSEQKRFLNFYKELKRSANIALLYWSGGYANHLVGDAFDELSRDE